MLFGYLNKGRIYNGALMGDISCGFKVIIEHAEQFVVNIIFPELFPEKPDGLCIGDLAAGG